MTIVDISIQRSIARDAAGRGALRAVRDAMRNAVGRAILGICLLLAAAAGVSAQPGEVRVVGSQAAGVRFYAANNGLFALNPETKKGSFFVPRDGGASYLFGAGLWFGARKMVDGDLKKLVFITYNPTSGASWARPGEHQVPELQAMGLPDTNIDPFIYNSAQFDPVSGNYLGSEIVPRWPLWLEPWAMAQAAPLRTGMFDPYLDWRGSKHSGSAGANLGPAMVAGVDEQIATRFHDDALASYEIVNGAERAGYPIGLQVAENIYAWSSGRYRQTVLVQYQIMNTSLDTLFNCVVGQVSDPDLGISTNDRLRFYDQHPQMRAVYVWSDEDTSRYGSLAMAIVEAPNTDINGMVDNSDRTRYRTEGRVGAFPLWSDTTDPKTSAERYDFMTTGAFYDRRDSGDQKVMLSSKTFSMRPGDTAYFAIMYAVLDSAPPADVQIGATWPELELLVGKMNFDYFSYGGFEHGASSGVESIASPSGALLAMPNPATDRTTLRFTTGAPSNVRLRLVNGLGQTVLRRELGALPAGAHDEGIDLSGLPSGFYLAVIETAAGSRPIPLTIRR